jgi:hypothetical protein
MVSSVCWSVLLIYTLLMVTVGQTLLSQVLDRIQQNRQDPPG